MEISPLIKFITYQLNQASNIALKIDEKSEIEYLHDFRVAIRRARSLLKLFFPKEKKLEKRLKEVVQQTNSLRELDIFLQSFSKEAYPSLYSSMQLARNNYFKTIWKDEFIKQSIKTITAIEQELLELPCPYSKKKLIKISHKHYKLSKKRFKGIKPYDSNEKLHKIRIHFKRSRYALDFLTKSFLSDESKKIIKCKKAQEYFGNIQDLANQIEWLKYFCSTSKEDECYTLLAIKELELEKLKIKG